ncbi:MAG TPA: hypothetical protein VGB83_09905 [Actinomycetota bacterium]
MIDQIDGIGVPGTPAMRIPEDQERLFAAAVRESVRRQTESMLKHRGVRMSADAVRCPRCGERLIMLDEPSTFVLGSDNERLCTACGAERDFFTMVRPQTDIGGEGG